MVAKAFDLNEDAFPRIPSSVHASLQKTLGDQLKKLYKYVDSPVPGQWKSDFASVYFVVAEPLKEGVRDNLKGALGATIEKIGIVGGPLNLFAIPTATTGKYYRVEVHECESKTEMGCAKFYLSYGDLGAILSSLARVHGFTLGTKGLKTHYKDTDDKTISGFFLSNIPEKVIQFYGLDPEVWKRGFSSQDDVFAWVASSRFFNVPALLAEDRKDIEKAHIQLRQMYYSFIAYTAVHKKTGSAPNLQAVREDALLFFGKKSEYDEAVKRNLFDHARREKFNGKTVMAWTELSGLIIRDIMNLVRNKVGVDGIINLDEKTLHNEVLRAQKELPPREAAPKKA